MASVGLTVRWFLRRAPLPHRLRLWLRPIARRVPASLIRYLLRIRTRKRIVSRVATPRDLPSLAAAVGLLPFRLPIPLDAGIARISIIIPFCGRHDLTVRCLSGL